VRVKLFDNMKRLIVLSVLFLCATTFAWSEPQIPVQSGFNLDNLNGHNWVEMSYNAKLVFTSGIVVAYHATWRTLDDMEVPSRVIEKLNVFPISVNALVSQIDTFYLLIENRNIPVFLWIEANILALLNQLSIENEEELRL
jgi:hypothetical protein